MHRTFRVSLTHELALSVTTNFQMFVSVTDTQIVTQCPRVPLLSSSFQYPFLRSPITQTIRHQTINVAKAFTLDNPQGIYSRIWGIKSRINHMRQQSEGLGLQTAGIIWACQPFPQEMHVKAAKSFPLGELQEICVCLKLLTTTHLPTTYVCSQIRLHRFSSLGSL